jgi:aryl-alcohol dehydrogenase-like predicted oxidoreductase
VERVFVSSAPAIPPNPSPSFSLRSYSGGESEKILGAWLAKRSREERRKLVISSKVRFPIDASNSNSAGLSRTAILDSVATSLERLHLEYLDILITHAWDDGTPLAETLSTLQDLVRGGKVRYVGVSNVTGWQLQKIVDEGRKLGLQIACLQTQYSLLCRGPVEWELAEVCDREGIALLPWSPLKGGWLSGKITREGGAPEGSRVAFAEKTGVKLQSSPGMELATDRTFDLLDALREIGAKNACSVPQAAIHWLLQQRAVASVVIGAKTLAQLEDNLGAVAAAVPKEDHARLTSLSDIPLPYPYEMVFRVQAGRKH